MFLRGFNGNRKSAKHTYSLSFFWYFWGVGITRNRKTSKNVTFFALKGNVWGGFCEITENASRELAKNDRFLHSFFAPGGITQRLRFLTPPDVFGHFVIFQDPEIQKGQKPLEG